MSAKVGISLIGTPGGFESASLGTAKALNMSHLVDLDNSLINILPDTDILVVRREFDGRLLTFITYYRFAKEIKTSRTGSFYGGSLLFEGFVPDKIPVVLDLLKSLADTVNRECIDQDENRFHSHIQPAALNELKKNKSLLEPGTYLEGDPASPRRLFDRRCFLSLDESVPDYEDFLYEVLLSNPEARTSLPGYHFVYTSKHDAVIDEVKSRKGLDIQTLVALQRKYERESGEQEEMMAAQRPTPPAEDDTAGAATDPPAKGLAHGEKAGGLVPSIQGKPVVEQRGQATGGGTAQQSPANDGTQDGEVTRVVIPVPEPPVPPEQASEDDASLRALARQLHLTYKAYQGYILPLLIIVGALLGVFFLFPMVKGLVSLVTGGSFSPFRQPIYYDGCRNLPGSVDNDPVPKKCQPDNVGEEFEGLLAAKCPAYTRHLETLPPAGEGGVSAYRDSIRSQIRKSLFDPQRVISSYGKGGASALSREASTGFYVDFDFHDSQPCLDGILNNPRSGFTTTPTIPRQLTPVVENSPPPARTPQTSTVPVAAATPRVTTTPRQPAPPPPAADPTTTQMPRVQIEDMGPPPPFPGSLLGNVSGAATPKPKATPRPTPTPAEQKDPADKQPAGAAPTRQPLQEKKGKKGEGPEKSRRHRQTE